MTSAFIVPCRMSIMLLAANHIYYKTKSKNLR